MGFSIIYIGRNNETSSLVLDSYVEYEYGIPFTENGEFCPQFTIFLARKPTALWESVATGEFIVHAVLG